MIIIFQVTLWVLLLVAWLVPCVISMTIYYGFSEVVHDPEVCYTGDNRATQAVINFFSYYLPIVTMLIMSIVLIVICCKQRGKEPAACFLRQSLISCCACAVVDIIFMSPWMFFMFFGWYDLWMIAAFMGMCLRGMLCLFWLVICKDIRDSALCKSAKNGEKAELLPK